MYCGETIIELVNRPDRSFPIEKSNQLFVSILRTRHSDRTIIMSSRDLLENILISILPTFQISSIYQIAKYYQIPFR